MPEQLLHEIAEGLLKTAGSPVRDDDGDPQGHLCGFGADDLERLVSGLDRKISRLQIRDGAALAVERRDVDGPELALTRGRERGGRSDDEFTHQEPGDGRQCHSHWMPPLVPAV